MKTEVQVAATVSNFDGTAGNGLFTFAGVSLPASDIDTTVIITGVAVENGGTEAIPTIDCYLFPPSLTLSTLTRYTVARLNATENAAAYGFSKLGCHIPVPRFIRGSAALELWALALITTGKQQTANFIVSYQVGKVLPNG